MYSSLEARISGIFKHDKINKEKIVIKNLYFCYPLLISYLLIFLKLIKKYLRIILHFHKVTFY